MSELVRLHAENLLLRQQNASAAVLRQAFNEAARSYATALSKGQLNGRGGDGWQGEPAEIWSRLYEAITSTTAGLHILSELENAKQQTA